MSTTRIITALQKRKCLKISLLASKHRGKVAQHGRCFAAFMHSAVCTDCLHPCMIACQLQLVQKRIISQADSMRCY